MEMDKQNSVYFLLLIFHLVQSSVFVAFIVFGAIHKYYPYSLSSLFTHEKKGNVSVKKKEISLQEHTLTYGPPFICTAQNYAVNPGCKHRHCKTNQFILKGTAYQIY